ncbi:hypothetical protein [Capnocytophaga canis]|uniref:Uncharacterized protein n=1 Tax=Capnocytophaga canis TaxID=1848903 RepID=A0A0B7IKN3_9FLAO|nr:hypothetical protein [Capnocytophaga canis]CEN52460.1 hypothetical protein CCAND93_250004 [Capnocytophaga canis]
MSSPKDSNQYQTLTDSKNPLEYIGIEHNKFMEKFMYHLEKSKENGTWNNVIFLSEDYKVNFAKVMNEAFHSCYPKSNSTIARQIDFYNQLNLNEIFNNNSVNELDMAETVLNSKATKKDKEFTMNLLKDVYSTIDNAVNDEEAYRELEKVIAKHENLILSQDWKTNEDYALGAIAVAKYSSQFWKDYDFSKFRYNSMVSRPNNPSSSIIVGADIAGYVVGGVVGATAGSFGGPAGSVGGFLGGKAFGAWAGSGAAATALAIYDAWSDFFS